jgi:hypothetical protein
MSGRVVGWAMEQGTGSPAAKLVLVKLADNATEEGLAWPSVGLIKEHTEQGQSTVYRCLANLEALNLIKRTLICVNPGTEDEYTCDGWQLAVPAEWRIPRAGKRPRAAGQSRPIPGRETAAPRKAIPGAGMPYKEEPSSEPSLNLPHHAASAPEGRGVGPGVAGQPARASPHAERMARLARVIGPDRQKNHWFDGVCFREGPPLALVLATRARCAWVRDHFGLELRAAFGDDLVFAFEGGRAPALGDA